MTSPPAVRADPIAHYDATVAVAPANSDPSWPLATRVAFRFCFVYFGLYVVTTQMLGGLLPFFLPVPQVGRFAPVKGFFLWIGAHVLRLRSPIPIHPSGSGDELIDWVQAFSLLLVALVATAVWSLIDRKSQHHARLYRWFRLFMRFALATTMLSYGFAKVAPTQMPILSLKRLVEPFGNFSPMGVLWYSVGASPAYEVITGCAESLGGILLFLPRTTLLGALICLADVTMVFILNMTYDVPVKLFSFHLILFTLVLIAPNARRLFDLFIGHRSTAIVSEPPIGQTARAQRGFVIAQAVFGLWVIGYGAYGANNAWSYYGGGAPRSPLFGIWDVDQMSVAGVVRPPLLTDSTRWKRVIIQAPERASFQGMNDAFKDFTAAIDTTARTLTLTSPDPAKTKSVWSFRRQGTDRLDLNGTLDGRLVHLELKARPLNSFLLRSRGFNWIQELPFNK